MKFEEVAIRALENADRDAMIRKADRVIKKYAIDPEEEVFVKYYGERSVERDKNYVEKAISDFEKSDTETQKRMAKIARIFEALILEHGELSEWFGPNGMTFKTSLYDDIENKVDTIVEFSEDPENGIEKKTSHLALAIDETFSADFIKDKLLRIRDKEINEGKLAKIKYFLPKTGDEPGLKDLPRVIVGADIKTVDELGELWLEGKNKALGEHRIQFQILEELLIQLEAFGNYAEKIKKPKIAAIYRKAYETVKKIWDEKQKTLVDDGTRDSVFYAIKNNLSLFN
ncbi:MAG: hypothetical protein AAB503_01495 [Patescibacteria group bacterium]